MCVDWGVSIRKACGAICFDTSTYHYKSRRTDQAAVERRIKEICETRVRYGYRHVHVLLRREGWVINMKKTRRIYNELGLQLRNKHPKRRVKAKLREDRQEASGPNQVWAMDFVHDQLATGRKLRILTIVDTHSRYCPATDPRFSYRGEDVVQTLERVCRQTGSPKTIRVDNVLCPERSADLGVGPCSHRWSPMRRQCASGGIRGQRAVSPITNTEYAHGGSHRPQDEILSSLSGRPEHYLRDRRPTRWRPYGLMRERSSRRAPSPQRRDDRVLRL